MTEPTHQTVGDVLPPHNDRLSPDQTHQLVREQGRLMGNAQPDPVIIAQQQREQASSVLAASMPAVDPRVRASDQVLLHEVVRTQTRALETQLELDDQRRQAEQVRHTWAAREPGLTWLQGVLGTLALVAITALAILGISELLELSLQEFLFAPVLSQVLQGDALFQVSEERARASSLLILAALMAPFTLAVWVTQGRIHAGLKVAYLVMVELAFMVAFMLLRVHEQVTEDMMPLAIGIKEFALTSAHGLGVWMISSWWQRAAQQRLHKKAAERLWEAAQEETRTLERRFEHQWGHFLAQLQTLQLRESQAHLVNAHMQLVHDHVPLAHQAQAAVNLAHELALDEDPTNP